MNSTDPQPVFVKAALQDKIRSKLEEFDVLEPS